MRLHHLAHGRGSAFTLTDIPPMRNGNKLRLNVIAPLVLTVAIVAAGCGGKGKRAEKALVKQAARSPQIVLSEGYQALENQQYNEAIAKADEFLAGQPHGEGSPEALYLKG